MNVCLPEKLREFRKKQGLTQEQLAEAMGVTVGAVSKWESGASTPDVGIIMELADFFETSVDVLLGYTQQSASLEGSVLRLRELRIQKDYTVAFREAEKALQRFPNNFQVVYECARIYQLSGLEKVRQNLPAFRPGKPRYGGPRPLPGAVPPQPGVHLPKRG